MHESSYRALRVSRRGHVAEVTLLGPGKGNAMGPDFWREMPGLFDALDADDSVRCVVVRGDGAHFSYGLDLAAMMDDLGPHVMGNNLAAERGRLLDLIGRMQQACDRVARCRKPVVAAVTGWCIGGGLDLAAACDIRLCSDDARFSLREVKLAIVADIGALQRLPRIIGQGHTRQMAYTGGNVDAAHALRIGLVNELVEGHEALHARAHALAEEIAANPPQVVQGVKQVMDYCEDKSTADGLRFVAVWNSAFLQSADLAEAVQAFMERRPPRFTGQ